MTESRNGIALERDEDIAILRLDRPHVLNAIDQRMREEWIRLLRQIEDERAVYKGVIVTGTGRAFCSGGDVSEQDDYMKPTAHDGWHGQGRYQEIARLMRELSLPVITAVNGLAVGGGMAVALMSDLLVASEEAEFGVGQVVRGFVPDVGLTYVLPRLIGPSRALQMMMLYEKVDAERAQQLGFVNWVVPKDEVMPKALEIAKEIGRAPGPTLEWIKRVTYGGLDTSYDGALKLEAMVQGILSNSPAFTDGIADFRSGGRTGALADREAQNG
jgi:2-(1,2-epoxy-1,2-dihydrophenyl)acetyl-CoA isomerase